MTIAPPTQTPWRWTAKVAWLTLVLGLMACACLPLRAQESNGWKITKTGGARFAMVDLFVDSGQTPLAAYQLKFAASQGEVKIAGIEGGDHPAFKTPPYYDPKAMRNERVILAAFSTATADGLPQGKTRVATLHLQLSGTQTPKFELNLQTAAASSGKTIDAEATLRERTTP